MYQAIEAISVAGVINPLEPVLFDENEHLVILRLSRTHLGAQSAGGSPADWRSLVGALKESVSFNGDPLVIQEELRREWR